ncbi:MAG: ribonuclease D, partial [Gammaproteobacteria bacterium]|nr:ribonuclease D [Gammaproteobacteria bacterium]
MITAGQLITDQDAFARLCHECLELDLVALDTEFERTRTYYPRPALVQLCDARRTMLVDPTALADFSPLGELLARERPSKVMHACEGDIEVLEVLAGVTPAAVFDTQVAAAFTGHGYSASYGELLRKVLGVDLAKAETRSDWLARPLTPAQLEYATLDVAYLPALHAALAARLEALGRRRWFDEEMARLQASRRADREPERAWRKIRSARTLAPQARARLEALAAWREREARRRDLPRRMVVGDDALLGLALEAPHARAELGRVRALSARAARRYGDELLETLAGAGS